MRIIDVLFLVSLLIAFRFDTVYGFGSMGPISAAFGGDGFFCAIDASGKQEVICWGKNSSTPSESSSSLASVSFGHIPAMAALSGGEGFICGILANTSQAYCWSAIDTGTDLVPPIFRTTAYSNIAAGKDHVCAVRGSYFSDHDSGTIDCWDIMRDSNASFRSEQSVLFYDQSINSRVFKKVVSGEGFSCATVREGGIICWGPNSIKLGVSSVTENYVVLASGKGSICGISESSMEVKCWGDIVSFYRPSILSKYVSLTAGNQHFCGIRWDNHAIECWGLFNSSLIPKSSGFMAIASSDYTTCGIREDDLVLDCWSANDSYSSYYDPPLELCSPGLCSPSSCEDGKFAFNASILNEPDLTSLCVRKDLKICSPCGSNCSEGFFVSSLCSKNSDRICTACSLCQNDSCSETCGVQLREKQWSRLHNLIVIVAPSVAGFLLILMGLCLHPRVLALRKGGGKRQFKSCISKSEIENLNIVDQFPLPMASCPGAARVFRLSELKDATNGFKEFNELGRGSYGFVYKAVLADGQQVAVKRANAATIIHTNNKDFEMDLEILCKVRHCNLVNLLGYCSEMGERLLVYEYMPHGTLYDRLHGGFPPLEWSLRLKISMEAAKGLRYLHNEIVPPVIHRNVKSSNVLLDSNWGARIADLGLAHSNEKDVNGDLSDDVYAFGVVLLEIISGRKAYDRDFTPSGIVEWAVPLIKQGKAAAIIDRYAALPRNVEPILKLVDVAELAVRENPRERPTMADLAHWLEQIVKDGLIS